MVWMETCAVNERMRFVIEAEKREEPFAAICRHLRGRLAALQSDPAVAWRSIPSVGLPSFRF